ncbi:MAG: ribbon-helix-helix protein, CopG family [Chromatiales bacterium]|jgi:metal-responsive CopG/Arc/MetJ family transcriptional regulator|nr:ribbon-helix-helix protein, CopG family [Chromatiales bacterium]
MASLRPKTRRITVSLTEDEHGALEGVATREDVSLSWVVRRALQEYLERQAAGEQRELALTQQRSLR